MDIKSLTIYCSSSDNLDLEYYQIANIIGEFLGKKKIKIIYGGGNVGLMGKIANSAFKNGSEVIGIMPKFLANRERINYNITKTIVVKNMVSRKKKLFEKGDAFLVLPGGSGTIEEITEIISWKILGIHNKEIIFYNHKNYWKTLFKLYDNCIDNKFGKTNIQNICKNVKTLKELKKIIVNEKN